MWYSTNFNNGAKIAPVYNENELGVPIFTFTPCYPCGSIQHRRGFDQTARFGWILHLTRHVSNAWPIFYP